MKIATRREVERNLAKLLAEHGESGEPLLILSTTAQANPMIVISQRKYDELVSAFQANGKW